MFIIIKKFMGHTSGRKDINKQVEKYLTDAYRYIEIGELIESRHLLNQAQMLMPYNKELQAAIRACVFWDKKLPKLETISILREKGDYLQRQWENFENLYQNHFDHTAENVRNSLKVWIFSTALKYYNDQLGISEDAESMFQAGRCFKKLGHYDKALVSFEDAVRHSQNGDVRYLAEMANAAILTGKERTGKLWMREALYMDASRVEIKYLDAPVFKALIERLKKECSIDSPEFNEWLPVYGTIWGVFDVKRELEAVELDQLKQRIHELSSEISDGDTSGKMVPKLINNFFWLIEHCETVGDPTMINDALAKIKHFAPDFYDSNLNNNNNRPGRTHV